MREKIAEKVECMILVPLPETVLFPYTIKPFKIMDPYFVKLIDEAVEHEAPVILANAERRETGSRGRSGLDDIRRVAGAGRIKLLERRSDPSRLVLLEGIGKVRIENFVVKGESSLWADAVWIEEDNMFRNENILLLNRMMGEFVEWLEFNVLDPERRGEFLSELTEPEKKINYICSLLVLEPRYQQILLETNDINEKLKKACLYIESDKRSQ